MLAKISNNSNGEYLIEGELDKNSVPALAIEASQLLRNASAKLIFDLAAVSRSDSAGVALLVEWMQLAAERQLEIEFRHLPEQMRAIAHASNLDELLPISD